MTVVASARNESPDVTVTDAPMEDLSGLREPELVRQVSAMRISDNITNWPYLLVDVLFVVMAGGGAVFVCEWWLAANRSPMWLIPVIWLAVILMGIGQHRLAHIGHEGAHYMLFRNRWLNDMAANWFWFYPAWTTQDGYRLQHFAHHQYTNDPVRDPNQAYMQACNLEFCRNLTTWRLLKDCALQPFMTLPTQLRTMNWRARLANFGTSLKPYTVLKRTTVLVRLLYTLTLVGCVGGLILCSLQRQFAGLWIVVAVSIGLMAVITPFLNNEWFSATGIKPIIPARWSALQRFAFFVLQGTALTWLTLTTGRPWPLYYLLLWIVPLFTTFAWLMSLRDDIQHGGLGRSKLRNSREFRGSWFVKWAVFPWAVDYHLGHHLFPMVPHYKLPELDRLLLTLPAYRDERIMAGPTTLTDIQVPCVE